MHASRGRRAHGTGFVVAGALATATLFSSLAVAVVGGTTQPIEGPASVADIPPAYLAAYEAAATRFRLGPDGWSYLAGIGEVESDHGRSSAPGVTSGQNSYGCCAGPMQINNDFGAGTGTWGEYGVDGDGDGRLDIYDIADAAATAARYLQASGAPADWHHAIFAYNHDQGYVATVLEWAARYRATIQPEVASRVEAGAGGWLAAVPGFPGERCDARIVPDVVALTAEFGLRLTACFGGPPHAVDGEHPLGLAADLVPVDGDWNRTLRLAETFGWSPSCATSGCSGRGPFRVILYNGYPGHGDPAHSATPHLHLSWQHAPAAPFSRAAWVRVLLTPSTETP
jgi:Transglycosylase SLT domain